MSPIRLTLHVGQGKTGSSHIQATCAANRALLAERWKILYPGRRNDLGQGPRNHSFVFKRKEEWLPVEEVRSYFESCVRYCEEEGLERILISWEPFHYVPWVEQIGPSLASLDVPKQVVVYLRRQDHWLESAWKQWHNKLPEDPSLSEFVSGANCDWYEQLERWAKWFGRENIVVRPYEKQQMPGGLLADFFAAIGCDAALVDSLEPAPEENRSTNSGFSRDVMELLRLSRPLNRSRHDNRLFEMLSELLEDEQKKPEFASYGMLSPAERLEILTRYEPANERIAREYLGRADGKLFQEPWPAPDEPWTPYEGLTLERAVPLLMGMLLKMHERLKDLE